MPVKKPTRKAKANQHREEESAADREAIRKLVDDLPHIMLKEGYLAAQPLEPEIHDTSEPEDTDTGSVSKPQPRAPHTTQSARRFLWASVSFFTLLIFAIWTFHIRTFISDIRRVPSPEDGILSATKSDLDSLFTFIKDQDAKLEAALPTLAAEAKAEEALRTALANLAASSTASSTATNE